MFFVSCIPTVFIFILPLIIHLTPFFDTIFVTLTIRYLSRWIRRLRKRSPVLAQLALQKYQTHMGHVDRFDKNNALFRLRMKRCMKRYHRAVFMWYLGVVLNNCMCLCDWLCADIDELKKSKESSGLGYKHWYQNEFGDVLIVEGLRLAIADCRQKAASTIIRFMCNNKGNNFQPANHSKQPVTRRVALCNRSNTPRTRDRGRSSNKGGRPTKRPRHAGSGRLKKSSTVKPKRSSINATLQGYLDSFAFSKVIPHFVPRSVGRKRKSVKPAKNGLLHVVLCVLCCVCLLIGSNIHLDNVAY